MRSKIYAMHITLPVSWRNILHDEIEKVYFKKLIKNISREYITEEKIFPHFNNIFQAFTLCSFENVKVVILGQDPYHGEGQAHGLAFSVPEGVHIPPSLQNIYKELQNDLSDTIPKSGNLSHWAKQGVLLLNSTLTVQEGKPASHQGFGWEIFTDAVIQKVSDEKDHVVFLLWGNYARQKIAYIDTTKHCVLTAPHPSPLSAHRGFFGSRHFSKTNAYLIEHGIKPILW